MAEAKVGVIGGTGLYQLEGMSEVKEVKIKTPFGNPSDAIVLGEIDGVKVAFLPRHGRGHPISPTELPSKANIYAMKSLGVEYILSVATVGSLQEKIRPLDIVIPDQIIDRTFLRQDTFFGRGIAVHIPFAEPFCPVLGDILYDSARKLEIRAHDGGICIVMEGPQFSTRAESELYRSWGADVIYMTGLPEAKLAREAEICYATIALATDYDCWHEQEGPVDVAMVIKILQENVSKAQATIRALLPKLKVSDDCPCRHALKDAIITDRRVVSDEVKKRLDPLIGRYLKE